MSTPLDSTGGESGKNREEIILDVVAPPKDFMREGGIANAMTALNALNALLDKTNVKFKEMGNITAKVTVDTAGINAQIQNAVKPLQVPVEIIPINKPNVTGTQVTRGADVMDAYGQMRRGPVLGGVETTSVGKRSSEARYWSLDEEGGERTQKIVARQNLQAAWKDQEKAWEQRVASPARAWNLAMGKSVTGEMGLVIRNTGAWEKYEADQKAAADKEARGLYSRQYKSYEDEQRIALGQKLQGITGTSAQTRGGRASAAAGFYGSMSAKASDLSVDALAAGHGPESEAMAHKAGQAWVQYSEKMSIANQANQQFSQSNRLIGKNMLENIKHVSTWAASVGVLYGSLALLRRSLEENMEIGNRMAVLQQIFKGSAEECSHLADSVMELAAANGQNATQAVVAATEFARIYHTQGEILSATNSALVLANISGMEAAHTTEFLSAMTQVYKVRAGELAGMIGEMAYASQNFNVTNKDLMKGLEATAESAKEAGVSFSQLVGFVSAGVGATGQSGTAVGNTIKTMVQEMANPEIQQKMRAQGIEVTQGGVGLKGMPQIFKEMFEAYERMSEAERRSMLFNTAGRQNATRMAAILDNYVQSQIIAVQAQLNLNAAQQENEKIMATLKAQTAAMVAEWDKFVKIQGDHGPMAALTGMATALKNLLSLMNAPGINILVALLGAGVLATGAKMAITGIGMNMAKTELSGMKGGLAASTLRALSGDLAAAGLIATNVAEGGFLKMVTQLDRIGMSSLVAQRGMVDFTSTMKAAGIAFAVFSDIVLPLAILAEGMSLFNTASTYFNHPAPNISQVDAYGGQAGAARDRAALDDTVASVLADPNVPQSRKDTLLKSMSGLGVGASNIRQDAAANRRLASIYSDAQIKEQQRVTEEYQQDLAQHTGWANKGSLWHWKSTGAEKMLEDQKNIAESQGKTLEMQRAQLEADAPMGPGYAGTEIAKGTPGARIAALSSAIGGIYGTMGTGSPLADHHRKLAELQSDRDMKKSAFDQINAASGYPKDASTLEGSINKAAWTAAQQAYIQAGTAYNAESGYASEGLSRKQTMLGGQARYAKADFSSLATGHTEGERMAHQDKEGANLAAFYRSHQEIAGALQIEVELTENKLKAQEKILELDKEIKNTQIEINREYARSLLTSSPSQLLEKLAVGQLSRGGRMSAGSFFSMTTSAREDYLKMPGHTEQERVLNRSRNALVNQFGRGNASSIGQAMLNGAPSQGAYHRLFGEMHAPDLGLIQSLAVTATNVHIVAQTVTVSGPAAPTPQGPSNGFNNPKFLPSTHSALSNVVGGGRVQDTRPPWAGGPTSYPPF